MIIIDDQTSRALLTFHDAMTVIQEAFLSLHTGDGKIAPVTHGRGPSPGSSFSMKGGLVPSIGGVGLKVGSYWPENRRVGLPSHSSVVLLLDPATGVPAALVTTSYLNALRTAAADMLAIRCLARQDCSTVGIVGTGHQAWFECLAVKEVRPIMSYKVWGRLPENAEHFADRLRGTLGVAAVASDLEDVAKADIVITATSSTDPIVRPEWLMPGAHLSAMGADAVGKREVFRPYPSSARLFADLAVQSRAIGEFQGLDHEIVELGTVLSGSHPGRERSEEITMFDSSGLAIQDIAIAAKVVELASKSTQ